MNFKLVLNGLDCANCANKIEVRVNKINGIKEATTVFVVDKKTSDENINAYTIIPNKFSKKLIIVIISKSLETFMRYWINFMKFSSSL